MFLGQYRHNMDEKGRLTIPSRFRELIADQAYITQGFERNLMVLTAPAFEAISRRVNQTSLTDQTTRDLKRLLFATAARIIPHKHGRILIPQFLRELTNLDGEAVLVGVGDYFEIWSPQEWEEQMTKLQDTDANAQRFSGVDLSVFLEP